MNITIKVNPVSLKDLDALLEKITDIRVALIKKYPNIVMNVEVEVK